MINNHSIAGIILGMGTANEKGRYIVSSSFIAWAHTQYNLYLGHEYGYFLSDRMFKYNLRYTATITDVLYLWWESLCVEHRRSLYQDTILSAEEFQS